MDLTDEEIFRRRREFCGRMSHARRLIHITGCVIEWIPPEDCPCVIHD